MPQGAVIYFYSSFDPSAGWSRSSTGIKTRETAKCNNENVKDQSVSLNIRSSAGYRISSFRAESELAAVSVHNPSVNNYV